MEQKDHKYITVAYELYADNEKGIHELIEQAPAEHPFQFISNLGVALDSFEEKITPLNEGDTFDFTLSVDEAYGPYVEEHVIDLDKNIFAVDGRIDKDFLFPGNVLPLVNADGNRFQGLILEVGKDTVKIDLNHPLAGKALHFKGSVVTSRPATDKELEGMLNMMSGEGCGCGCEDCGGECGHDHHHEGEYCGHHEHEHGEGCCGKHEHGEGHCGHHHNEHGEGCCGKGRHGEGHEGGCCGHHHE